MLEMLINGGWALWVIAGFSVIAMGVTFERWRTLRRADANAQAILEKLSREIDAGNIEGALDLCSANPGPVGDTLGIGLRKLVFLERIGKRPEEIEEGIVSAMEEHGAYVVNYLERNLTTLATAASLAPILGMLGTVVGMIRAFGDVKKMNNLSPQIVAGGISEALLCTAGGLIVAALATIEYNYFTTRVNRFVLQVQGAATDLVERVLTLHSQKALSQPQPAIRAATAAATAAPRLQPSASAATRTAPQPITPHSTVAVAPIAPARGGGAAS